MILKYREIKREFRKLLINNTFDYLTILIFLKKIIILCYIITYKLSNIFVIIAIKNGCRVEVETKKFVNKRN
jgi:hypothetical protein